MEIRSSERACFKNQWSERVRFKKRSTAMFKNSSWSFFQMNAFIRSIFETRICIWLIFYWRDCSFSRYSNQTYKSKLYLIGKRHKNLQCQLTESGPVTGPIGTADERFANTKLMSVRRGGAASDPPLQSARSQYRATEFLSPPALPFHMPPKAMAIA